MDEFERLVNGDQPEVQLQEITASGGEQIRRAVAGLIYSVTTCGTITWLAWSIHQLAGWIG